MANRALKISTKMAIIMGILLPLAETVRRSNQLLDPTRFLNWFDDYILGFILLLAAYTVKQHLAKANSYLIAAWGIGVGALGLSFIAQLEHF